MAAYRTIVLLVLFSVLANGRRTKLKNVSVTCFSSYHTEVCSSVGFPHQVIDAIKRGWVCGRELCVAAPPPQVLTYILASFFSIGSMKMRRPSSFGATARTLNFALVFSAIQEVQGKSLAFWEMCWLEVDRFYCIDILWATKRAREEEIKLFTKVVSVFVVTSEVLSRLAKRRDVASSPSNVQLVATAARRDTCWDSGFWKVISSGDWKVSISTEWGLTGDNGVWETASCCRINDGSFTLHSLTLIIPPLKPQFLNLASTQRTESTPRKETWRSDTSVVQWMNCGLKWSLILNFSMIKRSLLLVSGWTKSLVVFPQTFWEL